MVGDHITFGVHVRSIRGKYMRLEAIRAQMKEILAYESCMISMARKHACGDCGQQSCREECTIVYGLPRGSMQAVEKSAQMYGLPCDSMLEKRGSSRSTCMCVRAGWLQILCSLPCFFPWSKCVDYVKIKAQLLSFKKLMICDMNWLKQTDCWAFMLYKWVARPHGEALVASSTSWMLASLLGVSKEASQYMCVHTCRRRRNSKTCQCAPKCCTCARSCVGNSFRANCLSAVWWLHSFNSTLLFT